MIGCAGQWTRTPATIALQPKNKMLIFGLHSLLMIDWTSWWTWTPSATPLQPKKWNAHFLITFNFWWSAGLVNGLKPHLPALSSHKMKCFFLDYVHFWWSARLVDGLKPHPSPFSSQKNEILIFGLRSTSDDQLGWSVDSNPIHHPSPAKKMKCSFFDPVQLLMIGWAGRWTQTPSSTSLQPKKWNAHFLILFNFWWSAGLVDGLKPHPPPLSSQRNEMLIFWSCSTFDDRLGWSMDSNPIHHPSPAKTVKCSFLDYIQHVMLARLVNGLEPHPALLSSQKMKCSFLDYIQLLTIGRAGRWT